MVHVARLRRLCRQIQKDVREPRAITGGDPPAGARPCRQTDELEERDHLYLGPESSMLAPIFVLRTFPSPSRCSEKRNSSSAVCPVAMSRLRLTNSAVSAQAAKLEANPKRLSTKVSVRRSQFVSSRTTRFLQTSTESLPWRNLVVRLETN